MCKGFFGFSRKRLAIALVLVLVLFLAEFALNLSSVGVPNSYGIPFRFWHVGCIGLGPMGQEQACVNNFHPEFLILDTAIQLGLFYTAACLITKKKAFKNP